MALSILLFLPLLLFAVIDVWYFVRLFAILTPLRVWKKLRGRSLKITKNELLTPSQIPGIVLPSDLDLQLHMNNSKYLREMDFGRILFYMSRNLYDCVYALGGTVVVGASMIRYRKSLKLWERFSLKTRILCWSQDALYMEQRFLRSNDGFVCAVALLKMSAIGISVDQILERLCIETPQSPPFPPEVEIWAKTIDKSKEVLRKERE